MSTFLRTNKAKILSGEKPVRLKGINLGGWLMMEAYILHAPNFTEQKFKKEFAALLGHAALHSFEEKFRRSFIKESDFKNIAKLGFNCIRLPFNSRLIEKSPFRHDQNGVNFLDRAIQWAKKYKIWVILDLHAAPGAQNHDWHGDSLGQAELWTKERNQKRTYALWEFLADRYKNEEGVAGYDLLNESVLKDAKLLNRFYKQLIKRIRKVDPNHILFVEGNMWATNLKCLDEYKDDNYALSFHNYEPLKFTFNFVPGLRYPLKESGGGWNRAATRRHLLRYKTISQDRGVPILVGEFGINARAGLYGEDRWLADLLECFNDYGFHWTYWTYKAVKGGIFPDGLYSYRENPPWVNRPGPVTGWDTYKYHWRKHQKDMVKSWHTNEFTLNKEVLKVLKDAF